MLCQSMLKMRLAMTNGSSVLMPLYAEACVRAGCISGCLTKNHFSSNTRVLNYDSGVAGQRNKVRQAGGLLEIGCFHTCPMIRAVVMVELSCKWRQLGNSAHKWERHLLDISMAPSAAIQMLRRCFFSHLAMISRLISFSR